MLLYPTRWVPPAVLIFANFTQSTHATTVSLLDLLPKCASKCLESFISTEYPRNACSGGCDLTYLCRKDTKSGYTLGEAALRCSLSLCSTEVAMSFDTYSICDSVPGALPQTHPTIVATITVPANPTTTTIPTTIITAEPDPTDTRPITDSTSTKTDHTSTRTTTFQGPTSTTDSTQGSSTETQELTSTTSTDSAPEPTSSDTSSAESEGSALDSGAVIGVSVASGIAGFFIIGVIIFFCCRKMRRKAQDREFFEIGGHMSEPPDFNFPPRRPMGPRPTPGTQPTDSESVRLVTPADTGYQHPGYHRAHYPPAVIVTEPEEEDHDRRHVSASNTDRAGHQSSAYDYETASIASSRTVSDLLPDKPTYELYPRPLRWSLHKKLRPSSRAALIDEETGSKNHPSPSIPQFVFIPASEKGQTQPPMAGLPANPRAMKYGFASPGQTQAMKASARGKRPVYSIAIDNQPSRKAATPETTRYPSSQVDYDNDLDNYWKKNSDAGFVGAQVIQPQGIARSSVQGPRPNPNPFNNNPAYPGYDFEFGFGDNTSPESQRESHHSGSFRPLTPVREIRTPMGEVRNPMGVSSSSGLSNPSTPTPAPRYPPRQHLGPGLPTQPQEVVSRPRIVRQDDVKRVQIRRPGTGKPLPSPKEVTVPYCPDDYWHEQNNEASNSGYNVPTVPTPAARNPEFNSGLKGVLGMPKKKPSPAERNLTPSRRGADLILQVE
ncbi:uncharacterized protein BDV17DRAFT_23327 [Aspergillus undulatus]|uniref:uncharacterized protein n=1 Tax=Aspergillus undulatus TaxID=1810928 RepID=UPI003CCE192A